MAVSALNPVAWEEIELSESYLVCGMFEEASTLASSVLSRINTSDYIHIEDEILLHDMVTSAAMVLIQSWKETGRISTLLVELENYFGSVTAIPVQVVLTGACLQVSGGHSYDVCTFLENFLSEWKFDNDKYHAIHHPSAQKIDARVCNRQFQLEVYEYLEIAEFYASTLLGGFLDDVDRAILWVEKAELPEEARQDLLRRLRSLSHLKSTSLLKESGLSSLAEEPESHPLSKKEVKQSNNPTMVLNTHFHNRVDSTKLTIWRWLQTIIKSYSNVAVRSNGKLLLGCLIFLACYFIRKKRHVLMRVLRRRALSVKQAMIELWQLAFSYQVNPLAAVQPLPTSAARSW